MKTKITNSSLMLLAAACGIIFFAGCASLQTDNTPSLLSQARLPGAWDSDKPAGNTYNTLVVTTEQLQQIRALREQADAQECAEKG